MKPTARAPTNELPPGSTTPISPSGRTQVDDLLECCALSCGVSAVAIVASFAGGSRIIAGFGDPSKYIEPGRETVRSSSATQSDPAGEPDADEFWYAEPIDGAPSLLMLVAVAETPSTAHPEIDRLLKLFAGQVATRLAPYFDEPRRSSRPETAHSPAPPPPPDTRQWRALELITEAVVAFDRQLRFSYLNSAAETLFSSPRDELMGRRAFEAFPPSPETRRAFQRAIDHRESTVLRDYSKSIGAWLETRVFPSPDGLLVYIRDVTEQHERREELRRSEERFRLLSAATNDALWEWDIARNKIAWSDAIETITGYSARDLSDPEVWASHVHEDDIGQLIQAVARSRDAGPMMSAIEHRFRHADGYEINLAVRGKVQCDEQGMPLRLLGGVSDVTERRRLNDHLMRADRLETVGRMSTSIAHDLNNLLTPITLSMSQIRELEPNPEVAEETRLIQSCVDRGADLIRRLLSFARGDEGERVDVDLSDIAAEVHDLLRSSMPRSIDFRIELEPDLPTTSCDPSQMHQVIANLCINARDAIDESGTITLALRARDAGATSSGQVIPPGRYVCISVTDTGTGIPAGQLDTIFEPFFTTKPKNQGTGLGLATVRSIVDSHDGFIDVSSDAETEFVVWIPAERNLRHATDGASV